MGQTNMIFLTIVSFIMRLSTIHSFVTLNRIVVSANNEPHFLQEIPICFFFFFQIDINSRLGKLPDRISSGMMIRIPYESVDLIRTEDFPSESTSCKMEISECFFFI